jgi:hypothetical protein
LYRILKRETRWRLDFARFVGDDENIPRLSR